MKPFSIVNVSFCAEYLKCGIEMVICIVYVQNKVSFVNFNSEKYEIKKPKY